MGNRSYVIVLLGMLLALMPVLNAAGAIAPSGILKYVPITISNAQSSATPLNFQQMVTVDSATYSSYEASNLQNIEFFYANGIIINSWLESGNSNAASSTLYWLNIGPQIPASGSLTVYMGFASQSTNLFNTATTGEAPQLSPSYAEYDNGAGVFNFYDDFAGTTLSSKWTPSSQLSYYVDNGITVNGQSTTFPSGITTNTLTNPYTFNAPGIVEFYGYVGIDTYGESEGFAGSPTASIFTYEYGGDQWYACNTSTCAGFGSFGNGEGLYGAEVESNGNVFYYENYNTYTATETSYNAALSPLWLTIVGGAGNGGNNAGPVYYMRERAYPPNGVMPSVSFGSIQ